MTRGEIWWVDFGLAFGSIAEGKRPAIIVQNDNFNASKIMTVIVIPLTTNTMLAEYKDNIFLEKNETGLHKDSVALTPQIGAVDKRCLVEKISKLSSFNMIKISEAILDVLAL